MDMHTATEQAYKNGYNRALEDFANWLKSGIIEDETNPLKNRYPIVTKECVDNFVKEMARI